MTWLDKLLNSTREAESPQQFFYWAGLSCISAVLKNNVYLDRFLYKLYPNIYVLLISGVGTRKGIPINLAKRLVKIANNTRVIAGRSSIQGVIKKLSTAYSLPDGNLIKDATGFLVASEFADFIIQDPQALTILTDLYDGHYHEGEFENTLKSGVEILKNVCLTMVGASNEVYFKDSVPMNAIGGGFISRTAIVVSDELAGINSLTDRPTDLIPDLELAEHLKAVGQLKGEFKYSDKAKKEYDKWYLEFRTATRKRVDPTGTLQRVHDMVLKVAMLISCSRKLDMIIEDKDIHEALDVCVNTVVGVRKITMGIGRSIVGPQTSLLIKELMKRPNYEMSRLKVLQKLWGEFDSFDLDRIIETLVQAGALTVRKVGKETLYKLTDTTVEQYSRFVQEEE